MKTKLIFGLAFLVLLIGVVSAVGVSYCCERIDNGAWCQNAPEDRCDADYRKVPTSCESTSYCKLGTCIDSEDGTCMDNTPQKVCEDASGVWYDDESENLPQCELGCCILGDQAAFVTKTRCKGISSLYGLETNFRDDIQNEVQCIASAAADVNGACVFDREFEKTCLLITQKECSEMSVENSTIEFYEGRLCSDESLNTNCGPSKKTTCVEGKDEVYFVDTCGNVANVYDAVKVNNKEYWAEIENPVDSCGYGSSNADSATCGNCDYYLGSTCKEYKMSEDKAKPKYGDNVCRDLSCEFEGKEYEHGETFCYQDKGVKGNLPGARHFRLVCYNGEMTVEPCADFRAEICIESDIGGFSAAACRVNRWQDCVAQESKKNCENEDRRACIWKENKCTPMYPPGFNFWEAQSDGTEICGRGSEECVVVYEKGFGEDKKCVENCHCVTEVSDGEFVVNAGWEKKMNGVCISLGDCGSKTNYIGIPGYHDDTALYSGTSNDQGGDSGGGDGGNNSGGENE